MKTIEHIKSHAQELILRGAPFTKEELSIIKMGTPSGKAFNSGKRKVIKTGK